MANEISAVKARYLSRDAKEYARELARKSTEALRKTIKEHSGLLNMASADVAGGLTGLSLDLGSRYVTSKVAKFGGDGVRGWVGRHAANVSAALSGSVGTAGYIANALTSQSAPMSWWREAARTATGTLSIFGLDRAVTKALKIEPLP